MSKDFETSSNPPIETVGIGAFGPGGTANTTKPLFRVVAGHSMSHALEQSTLLLSCVDQLTDLAMVEVDEAGTLLCAAHYLSGMAKALVQDVSHGLMQQTAEIDSRV
ncbi:DUF3077 domain-containing protein [Pseudomonas sp. BNK-43-a]|uniref:DUF3077 domain-containing protein n=1 Tax=unclassified Pseudomonas TaxID=196821 RepID=UPI0039BEF25D